MVQHDLRVFHFFVHVFISSKPHILAVLSAPMSHKYMSYCVLRVIKGVLLVFYWCSKDFL